MYKPTDKMSELMGAGAKHAGTDNQVLQLIHRFGVPLGVGDKTIVKVCEETNIDCTTLLAIVNFAINREYTNNNDIHIPTLRQYLENAHNYFMHFQLPRIRQMLLEAINLAGTDNKIPLLIIRFYDEYVEEIRAHIQHENEFAFEYHPTDDQHIAAKAIEQLSVGVGIERPRQSVNSKVATQLIILNSTPLHGRLARVGRVGLFTSPNKLNLAPLAIVQHCRTKGLKDRYFGAQLLTQSLCHLNTASDHHNIYVGRWAPKVVIPHIATNHIGPQAEVVDNLLYLPKNG